MPAWVMSKPRLTPLKRARAVKVAAAAVVVAEAVVASRKPVPWTP